MNGVDCIPADRLPLGVTTTCPRCMKAVEVVLRSVAADTSPDALTFTPEYVGRHVCPDLAKGDRS